MGCFLVNCDFGETSAKIYSFSSKKQMQCKIFAIWGLLEVGVKIFG